MRTSRTNYPIALSAALAAALKDVNPLVPVTKDNVDAFARNWDKWLPK